jgi:hypothetical protein
MQGCDLRQIPAAGPSLQNRAIPLIPEIKTAHKSGGMFDTFAASNKRIQRIHWKHGAASDLSKSKF